jgi:hypothetical protein
MEGAFPPSSGTTVRVRKTALKRRLQILGCQVGNNGMGTGITIESNDVHVEGCTIKNSGTGIVLASTVTSGVNIIGNQIGIVGGGGGQPVGIDLSALPSGTDWLTIVGNNLGGFVTFAIKFPAVRGTLGVHSRITNNPGYNPVDPAVYTPPAAPLSNADIQNPYYSDAMVVITPSQVTISSIELTYPGESSRRVYLSGAFTGSGQLQVLVPCGALIRLVYTGGPSFPTWSWFPT